MARVSTKEPDRPHVYDDEIAQAILDRMFEGEMLEKICDDPDMPDLGTVNRWAINSDIDGFAERLTRAREGLGYRFAEKAIALAEDFENGKAHDRRLQIDTYKWYAGVAAPEKFGKYAGFKPRGHAGLPGTKGGNPPSPSTPRDDESEESCPGHLLGLIDHVAAEGPPEGGQVNGKSSGPFEVAE